MISNAIMQWKTNLLCIHLLSPSNIYYRTGCQYCSIVIIAILSVILKVYHFYFPVYLAYWPSVLWHCWLGAKKGIGSVKKMADGGGMHWLVRMEWCPARWSVCLPLLIFPCTIKSKSSLLAPAHPGGTGKRAIKRLWCCVVVGLLTSE